MLSADHLTRRFGERVAVDDVSFDVERGEILGLLGPNGAGKTTTLRMLAGLIEPTSGRVRIGGDTMTRLNGSELRSRIGLLTEAPGLWDRLTVFENLAVYAKLHGLDSPERRVWQALDVFDLRARADDAAALLSKGLRQRVAIARALLHEPAVLLLDEPTAGLDPESARDLRELVLQLRDQQHAILMSTHNLDEVERVADRVAVMRGRLVAVDTPGGLRSTLYGARLRVVLGQPSAPYADRLRAAGHGDIECRETTLSIRVAQPAAAAPEIVRLLVAAGADVQAVVPEEPPLEEVYLKLLREDTP